MNDAYICGRVAHDNETLESDGKACVDRERENECG